MTRRLLPLALLGALLVPVAATGQQAPAPASPPSALSPPVGERVAFPVDYASKLVKYGQQDRYDRPVIRSFYATPAAVKAGKPGFPDGTVLVAEDRKAKLDAEGKPVLDADGRMIPTDEVTLILVQEKRAGWGAAIPADLRNGDWDYAVFRPDGARRTEAKTDGCFSCHQTRAELDYTFILAPVLADRTAAKTR